MRYRWMFYLTGLPGWMRFGFSPGWLGRSPTGLPPCATMLLYGAWPYAFWGAGRWALPYAWWGRWFWW